MSTYDQWKTASPYDDDVDWAEKGAKCPWCGEDCDFEVLEDDGMEASFMCGQCLMEFSFEYRTEEDIIAEHEADRAADRSGGMFDEDMSFGDDGDFSEHSGYFIS